MPTPMTITSFHHVGLDALRSRWGWFLGLGVALAALGLIAMSAAGLVTLATMVFFGCMLIIGGVLEAAYAIMTREWGGYVLDLLSGILSVVVGVLVVTHPEGTAAALTLLIAMFLIFGGAFRIAVALSNRFNHWVWLLLHGVVNLALGVMIWRQWPVSGLWVIGLFIGIDMLLNGWSLIMLGLLARKLPAA